MPDPAVWTFGTGGDYSEQLDWLTDVQVAPTGGSQHRRLRQSPRVTLGFAALEEGRRRRVMEAALRNHSAGQWRVPVGMDACVLGTAAATADEALVLDTTGARFVAGGYALLRGENPLVSEVVQIAADGVDGEGLLLQDGLTQAWPAGTLVVPLRAGRLVEPPQVDRFTADASSVDLSFRLDEPLDDAPAIAGDTYRDYPVWPFRPVWTSDPVWSPERNVQGLDDGIAPPLVVDMAGVPQGRVAMQYAPDTRADVLAFRAALFALAGRWSPAWVPSWASDARLVSNVANGATTLDVEWPVLADAALASNQRDVRIELRNGTVLYRRITAVTMPGAGVERWTVAAIATGFNMADVVLVSFLTLCVQDADTNLLRYWTRELVECELAWRQLAHEL